MQRVLGPEEALFEIESRFTKQETGLEEVALSAALGRILTENIYASEDIPRFDRSAMDGYAVCAADTFGASEALPAMLKPVGEVLMGQTPPFSLSRGECAYIPTGGELPPGADSIVMIEYIGDFSDGYRYAQMAVAPGTHVIYRGDDVKKGQLVLKKGKRLRPQEIGALAALGVSRVSVRVPLLVGVLSTGDELVAVDRPQAGAVVRDVNSDTLAAGLLELGANPLRFGIIEDSYEALTEAIQNALSRCDALLISGGSSMGTADITHRIIDEAGSPGVFLHGIAVKPGKPTIVGDVGGKPVFGLPGHPVSAYFIYRMFAAPLFQRMMGQVPETNYGISAILGRNIPSNHGREEYVSVSLKKEDQGRIIAMPVAGKSGLITTLTQADGYLCIPRDQEGVSKGEKVVVFPF